MAEQFGFQLGNRNPDVLNCIANLSNDEVFTPPDFANRMLDLVADAWAADHDGADIWADPTLTYLDPVTKSGVFLREITKRLVAGLAEEIPDLYERVDHILTKQVFGVAITELTSLLARRTLYCSKWADGKHSVASSFDTAEGNIWFERIEHTWVGATEFIETADSNGRPFKRGINGRCSYCGANQKILERADGLETHAYAFIHADDIQARINELFGENMEFDVIIGNPPYQLSDGGSGGSALPIYHKFVEQAIELDPRYLVMVTPSRWFQGGRGLQTFRSEMLKDRRLAVIVDYIRDRDAIPGINVNGGVSYFLWRRDAVSDCSVTTIEPGGVVGETQVRSLREFDVFIRRNAAVPILRKVLSKGDPSFDSRVSPLKPFGLRTHFHGHPEPTKSATVKLYGSGRVSWVSRADVPARREWIDRWKVLVGRATDGNENYPLPVWDQIGPIVAGPGEACTETYLVAALLDSKAEADRMLAYMRTRFFRFLVSLRKATQDNKAANFLFVPDLEMDRVWTDDDLNKRYDLTEDEGVFISSMIKGWSDIDGPA